MKKSELIVYLEYAAVSLLIMGPLLKPGFIFAMDMAFAPEIRLPGAISAFYPIGAFLHYLNYFLPSDVIQKALMFSAVFFGMVGAHKLVPAESQWPKYFGGLFYIFNPFIYSRFLYGQLFFLLAAALLPWIMRYAIDLFERASWKSALRLGLAIFLAVSLSVHTAYFIVLILAILSLYFIFKNRRNLRKNIEIAKRLSLAVLIPFFLSSWWIALLFLDRLPLSEFVERGIDYRHYQAFQTAADEKYGLLFNTAAMYGFWGDQKEEYFIQKDAAPYWPYLYLLILAIALWGAAATLLNKKSSNVHNGISGKAAPHIAPMLIIGFISFILAVGAAYGMFAPFMEFLNQNIPFFKGYREPQKWAVLLALVYAYLGALGADDLITRLEPFSKTLKKIAPSLFLAIPILYSPGILWGFHGQLKAADYPKSWYETNEILKSDQDDFRVLFLPWHQYMRFDFAGRVIINPAPIFFDDNIIAGDNMEIDDIYTQSNRLESRYIEREIIDRKQEIRNMGEKLLALKIKYIIFAKEADFEEYSFIENQADLEKVYDKDWMVLYRNKAWEG